MPNACLVFQKGKLMVRKLHLSYKGSECDPRPDLLRSEKNDTQMRVFNRLRSHAHRWYTVKQKSLVFSRTCMCFCTLNNRARCLNARKTEASLPNRSKVTLCRGSRGRLQDGCGGDRRGRLEGGNKRSGGGRAHWLAVRPVEAGAKSDQGFAGKF